MEVHTNEGKKPDVFKQIFFWPLFSTGMEYYDEAKEMLEASFCATQTTAGFAWSCFSLCSMWHLQLQSRKRREDHTVRANFTHLQKSVLFAKKAARLIQVWERWVSGESQSNKIKGKKGF